MRNLRVPALLGIVALWAGRAAYADVILIGGSLNNGNLDRTHAAEIVPGFFLPKPDVWQNVNTRSVSGPLADGLSSEPWAGPPPTPDTTDGNLNPPSPEGCGGPDCAAFFKPFVGNSSDGAITGHLYQDVPATPGQRYSLSGWAGVEANALASRFVFALDFLSAANGLLSSSELDLAPTLFVPNGQPFNYKQFTVMGTAPVGAATVRARASMIGAMANPAGGGQAFVVDDFVLSVPEPATAGAFLCMAGLLLARRSRSARGEHFG